MEREFEKIYVNADLRQEIPEPVNMVNHELSSNFDSELDLTVLENKENEILDDCNMEDHEFVSYNENFIRNQQHQAEKLPTSTTATVFGTNSISISVAKTVNPQPVVGVKNPNQENALNKLLQKIRQQREDATVKNLNKDSDVSQNTPVSTPKHVSRK